MILFLHDNIYTNFNHTKENTGSENHHISIKWQIWIIGKFTHIEICMNEKVTSSEYALKIYDHNIFTLCFILTVI